MPSQWSRLTPEEREHRKVLARQWYAKNKDRRLAANRAWAKKNPEKVKAGEKRWCDEHRDHVRARCAAWYQENREYMASKAMAWKALHPEEIKAGGRRYSASSLGRAAHLVYNYEMSLADYEARLHAQNEACAICREAFVKTPHVDHCHKTGRVRGLLCSACNKGLGFFRDTEERLTAAIHYLKNTEIVN